MSSEQFSSQRPAPAAPTSRPPVALTAKQKKHLEEEEQAKNRRKIMIRAGLALLLLLLIGSAYALFAPDEVAQTKAKIEAIRNNAELSDSDKGERIGKLVREDTSQDTQDKLRQERMEQFRKRENELYAKFFAKSPAERKKEIREQIQASEKRRKEREARGGGGPGGGGFGGGGPGGAGAGGAAGQNAAGGAGANGNGPGRRGGGSQEDRQAARDVRQQNFTPAEQNMRASYRSMVNQEREAMGLPPTRRVFPPGFGFGGRGGFGGGFGGGPPAPPANPAPPAPPTGS
jgi:hypothetical protein